MTQSEPSPKRIKHRFSFYVIDICTFEKLLPILKANGVSHFKNAGLEISFHAGPISHVEELPGQPLPEAIAEALHREEQSLPADLRTDNITDYDKVLNWSGSPDQEGQGDIPLTGEAPL